MSSRHQKEKRLRPRNDPYKRNHFDKTKYMRVDNQPVAKPLNEEVEEKYEEYEEMYDEDFS